MDPQRADYAEPQPPNPQPSWVVELLVAVLVIAVGFAFTYLPVLALVGRW